MFKASIALVIVAFGTLAYGWVNGNDAVLYASIASSGIAGLALLRFTLSERRDLSRQGGRPAGDSRSAVMRGSLAAGAPQAPETREGRDVRKRAGEWERSPVRERLRREDERPSGGEPAERVASSEQSQWAAGSPSVRPFKRVRQIPGPEKSQPGGSGPPPIPQVEQFPPVEELEDDIPPQPGGVPAAAGGEAASEPDFRSRLAAVLGQSNAGAPPAPQSAETASRSRTGRNRRVAGPEVRYDPPDRVHAEHTQAPDVAGEETMGMDWIRVEDIPRREGTALRSGGLSQPGPAGTAPEGARRMRPKAAGSARVRGPGAVAKGAGMGAGPAETASTGTAASGTSSASAGIKPRSSRARRTPAAKPADGAGPASPKPRVRDAGGAQTPKPATRRRARPKPEP